MDNAKSNNFKCLGLKASLDNEDIIMGSRENCSLSASAHKSKSQTFNGQRWSNVSDRSAPEGSKGVKLLYICSSGIVFCECFTMMPLQSHTYLWYSNAKRTTGVSDLGILFYWAVYLICIHFPGFQTLQSFQLYRPLQTSRTAAERSASMFYSTVLLSGFSLLSFLMI